jgi:hypothetical protein
MEKAATLGGALRESEVFSYFRAQFDYCLRVHGAAKSSEPKKKASREIKNAENSRESGSEAEKQFSCS